MRWAIKQIHNISRPGESPRDGDSVHIECIGGYIKAVDPITRKETETPQVFVVHGEFAEES